MKRKGLTIEKSRELTGENYSDKEVEETVDVVKQRAFILAEFVLEQEKKQNKNRQRVLNLLRKYQR